MEITIQNITSERQSLVLRVGVYLDHMAGTLSFYSISETMTLQITFTQPLHAGLGVHYLGSTAELFELKKVIQMISPRKQNKFKLATVTVVVEQLVKECENVTSICYLANTTVCR